MSILAYYLPIFLLLSAAYAKTLPLEIDPQTAGGTEAKPKEIPYQAFLSLYDGVVYGAKYFCSGVLISRNYVLTSGWCMSNGVISGEGTYGMVSLKNIDEHVVEEWFDDFIIHPNYNNQTYENDIALVKLRSTIKLSDYIRVAKLPRYKDSKKNYGGKTGRVSGYNGNNELREVSNVILANNECKKQVDFFNKDMLCLSVADGRSACNGDWGGPLVVGDVVVGIEIFSGEHPTSPCPPSKPTVYARIDRHLQWIEDNSDVILRPDN